MPLDCYGSFHNGKDDRDQEHILIFSGKSIFIFKIISNIVWKVIFFEQIDQNKDVNDKDHKPTSIKLCQVCSIPNIYSFQNSNRNVGNSIEYNECYLLKFIGYSNKQNNYINKHSNLIVK